MNRFRSRDPRSGWLVPAIGMVLAAMALPGRGEVTVIAERADPGLAFKFATVPLPANNDAATKAEFTVVDGRRDPNGGELAVLHDGRVPTGEDQPSENFFFRAGSDGGRLAIDLGRAIRIKAVNTFSWHAGSRGPQVFRLYAADGTAAGFVAAPGRSTDPASCGWTLLAGVDTRPKEGDGGGCHGVTISDAVSGSLGKWNRLLLDIVQTEARDPFGNTFFSEIDVMDADGPAPTTTVSGGTGGSPVQSRFEAEGGKYQFTLDATVAPDLKEWAETKLKPVVQEWYPKLVAMLPSDGFTAPTEVTLRFRDDMRGTPASAGGARVNMNSEWFRKELDREARGAVVHELVHVVQEYGRARRTNPDATRTPGWLVEGIPDYIRWFLYEPETKGAELTERTLPRARYDGSYRISASFLDWVVRHRDKDLIRKLNGVCREGKYTDQVWKDWTGQAVESLAEEWKKANEKRIKEAKPPGGEPGR